MKRLGFDRLPALMAVVLMCGLLTACVQAPVSRQTEGAPPIENTQAPDNRIESADMELSEDGRLSSDSANAVNLQAVLDSYFASRVAAINEPETASPITGGSAPSDDAVLRANALREFWEKEGVYIVSVEASYEIREIAAGELPGTVDLDVYELTWVDYNNVGVDAPAGDRFGYGNDHKMTVSMNSNGTFSIIKDGYDEWDVSGYTSADYDGSGACAAWE